MLLVVGLVVLTTNTLMPTIVGTHVDSFGLTLDQAGYAAAAYMAGGGLGGLVTGALLLRAPTRLLLFAGLAGLAVGNFLSIFVNSFGPILIIRFIAGIGEGIGFALMGAGVSRQKSPQRMFGLFTLLLLLVSAAILSLLPMVREYLGGHYIFLPIALAPALLLFAFKKFPDLSRRLEGGVASTTMLPTPRGFRTAILAVPVATFIVYIAYGAQFAYVDRLGVSAGLSVDAVSYTLALGSLFALIGAGLATVLRGESAVILKLSAAVLVVLGAIWLCTTRDPFAYRLGVILLLCGWFFFAPSLMGLMSTVDRTGRIAAVSLGTMGWGLAAGPALAAFLVPVSGLHAIGWIATVGIITSWVLLIFTVRRARIGERAD